MIVPSVDAQPEITMRIASLPNKFAERKEGTKQEKQGTRISASAYSQWHRTIGSEFCCMDLDYIEWRKGRGIVALIDVTGNLNDENHIINSKEMIWTRTEMQRDVLETLSKAIGVPAYFVIHTTDLSIFHVHNLAYDLKDFTSLSRYQYTEFVKSL